MASAVEPSETSFPTCNYPKRCLKCSNWIFPFDAREEFIKRQNTYQHVQCKSGTPNPSSSLPATIRQAIIHQYASPAVVHGLGNGSKSTAASDSSVKPNMQSFEPQILNMQEVAAMANNAGNAVSLARLNIRSPIVSSTAIPKYQELMAKYPKLDIGTIVAEYASVSISHWFDTGLTWETVQEYIISKRKEYPFNPLYGIITLKKAGLTITMIKKSLNVKESQSLREILNTKTVNLTKKEWNVLDVNNDNYTQLLGLSWFEWVNLN